MKMYIKPNTTCIELVRTVHNEVKFPLENRFKLTEIFNRWVEKHIGEIVEDEHDYIHLFGESEDHNNEFKTVMIRSFVKDSKLFDNHKWLADNLK